MNYRDLLMYQAAQLGNALGQGIAQRDADRRQRLMDEEMRANQMAQNIGNFSANSDYANMLRPAQTGQPFDYTKLGASNMGVATSIPTTAQANANNPYQFNTPNAVSMLSHAPSVDDMQKQANLQANFMTGGHQIFNR